MFFLLLSDEEKNQARIHIEMYQWAEQTVQWTSVSLDIAS